MSKIHCYYCKRPNVVEGKPLRICWLNYDGVGICIDCLQDALIQLRTAVQICGEASKIVVKIAGEVCSGPEPDIDNPWLHQLITEGDA